MKPRRDRNHPAPAIGCALAFAAVGGLLGFDAIAGYAIGFIAGAAGTLFNANWRGQLVQGPRKPRRSA